MKTPDLRELLEEKFSDDPLYKTILRMDLKEQLFSGDFYNNIHTEVSYSTREATNLLELDGRDYLLRNYIKRNDLNVYLAIPRIGTQLRMDYKILFKFKMIFLLVEHGKAPLDIANIVGTKVESYTSSYKPYNQSNTINPNTMPSQEPGIAEEFEDLNDKLENLQKLFILNQINQQKKEWLDKITDATRRREVWEKDISEVIEKIEIIEWTNQLHTQSAASPSISKEVLKRIDQNRPKESLWSKLFGGKSADPLDVDALYKETAETVYNNLKGSMPESIEGKYEELKKKREQLEKIKEKVYLEEKEAKEKFGPLVKKLESKSTNLLDALDPEDSTFKTMIDITEK